MATLQAKLKTKTTKPVVKAVNDKQHQEVVSLIRGRTMEMSFTVHGLPKSRRISGKLADQLASSVKGKTKGVRASWSMFTSDHPAVKELNVVIRELDQLRETWTIVKSAEVKSGTDDKVTIEGGKRLIWDKDVDSFHALFVAKAKLIDKCVEKLQHAMDNQTYDADGGPVKSVKEMDKTNAGEAWDEKVYPKDLRLIVGVSKERLSDGTVVTDANGDPVYLIKFEEYHVSEKLSEVLRERAIKRIDEGLSGTIETAMTYAVNELSNSMLTFLGELSNRTKLYPKVPGPWAHLYEGEVIKQVTSDDDKKVPNGYVKVMVRYEDKDAPGKPKISKWLDPMKINDFATQLKPQTTSEKKKIYPTVIEGIISQMQAFKDKKAKMLGAYGENLVAAFEPLLETLTKANEGNPWGSPSSAAQKLAGVLKTDAEVREIVSKTITDTVELLEEQVEVAKSTHKRRSVRVNVNFD